MIYKRKLCLLSFRASEGHSPQKPVTLLITGVASMMSSIYQCVEQSATMKQAQFGEI